MGVEPVNRSLSPSQDKKARLLESEGYIQWRIGRLREAWKFYEEDLNMRIRIQEEEDRPVHKGAPLHMMGLILLFEGKAEDALRHFILAYIEDTLNVDFGHEHDADHAPAARVLRDFFRIDLSLLAEIKRTVYEKKQAGLWRHLRDPMEILKEVAGKLGINLQKLLSLCKSIPSLPKKTPVGFPGPWEKRVFIGGNYPAHMPILLKIKEFVLRLGYEPIIVDEIDIPKDLIHHHSLMYLHTCKFAIFEVTSPGGQLMEVERAKDYDIKPLLLCTESAATTVTSMIQTAGLVLRTYSDIDRDLFSIIRDYLSGRLDP